jgi:SAM-dependent methyltransferase
MADRHADHRFEPTSSDVLLANQLYYGVEAAHYDRKNHVSNPAILRYYDTLLDRHVFAGCSPAEVKTWTACDVGCGTGFLEGVIGPRVGRLVAFDATHRMLLQAKAKFGSSAIAWVQADAQKLPVGAASFDLVCSNAMLHHVFGFEQVLANMSSLLKPGGKLFVGYEPNAIPYRLFWPVLKVAAKIVPEHRERDRIREASGQQAHPTLKDVDIHELSEFHIFHGTRGRGIDPFALRRLAMDHGIVDCRVHFSSIYQFALLKDSGIPLPVHRMPDWLFKLSGRWSLSFSLTGTKAR